ncbi:UvrD-helicase domain-containing protein [Alicyclobacillus ferrooxydans]|uniref:DNA 3'-5' helicase n=1 Tax=Alicyclobacillus ferrooxydans TaxID=471514 RepID=A0A0P9GT42_9BACL|nr:UvrD-helicase domain-containing protein [Alicyclobacillus ferrooxydans]KPV44282.1 hypothetical protein AN477_08305 [Alicyclobacillus ferrooxydans]
MAEDQMRRETNETTFGQPVSEQPAEIATRWSKSQQAAIDSRGENVIVSAGAGSGKTSVLVERVIRCVVDEPAIDLTRLLVVTFTEAAAAEMRKRVGDRLEALAQAAASSGQVEKYRRLLRQIGQLEQAQISTLHSFCMQVVRQNYLRLDLDPGFDILSEEDAVLLKTAVLERVIEDGLIPAANDTHGGQDGSKSSTEGLAQAGNGRGVEGTREGETSTWTGQTDRAEKRQALQQMIDMFGAGDPRGVFQLVFRLDTFARSQAEPMMWLDTIGDNYARAVGASLVDTPWYGAFAAWCQRILADALDALKEARNLSQGAAELQAYQENLTQAVPLIEEAMQALLRADWSQVASCLVGLQSQKSPRAKKTDSELVLQLKEEVQVLRKQALDGLKPLTEVVTRGTDALLEDISALAPAVLQLVLVTKAFQTAFMAEKQRRRQLDFNDLEHFAYEVLTDKTTGEAQRLQEQYVEIFVDEFQDTSPIQDALVASIARPQGNVFVVGDVKQSIYRFRMAEPGLFLDKYFGRTVSDEAPSFRPLYLSENYRSRRDVVNVVNFIFGQLFSEEFGGAPYDAEAQMKYAARYPDRGRSDDLGRAVEVHLLERENVSEKPTEDDGQTEFAAGGASLDRDQAESEGEEGLGHADADGLLAVTGAEVDGEPVSRDELLAIEREGKVIAARIREWMGLTGGSHRQVWDAKLGDYRPLQYRDIVILLRSVKGRMSPLLDIFRVQDIPAYGVTSTGFYGSLEIQWLLSVLAAVDNPRREIELVATMRSPMFRFTDSELAEIRLVTKGNFYDAVRIVTDAGRLDGTRRTLHRPAKSTTDAPPDSSVAVQTELWDLSNERADETVSKESAAALAVAPELSQKTRDFLQRLNQWRRLSRRATTEAVLTQILEDTGILDYLTAMTGGRVRVANVQILLERVRSFDRGSVDGVFGFVTHARELLQHEVDLGEARTLAEAEDVVRIMTIHQSKGLEFPIVFVADLGKQFYRNPIERALPLHRNMGFGPQRIDPETDQRWRTVPSIAIEEAETREFLAEEARILYVALTRAREQLVLVGSTRQLQESIQRAISAAELPSFVLPTRTLQKAKTPLDWLLPVLWRDRASADTFETFLRASAVDNDARGAKGPMSFSEKFSTTRDETQEPNLFVHIWSGERGGSSSAEAARTGNEGGVDHGERRNRETGTDSGSTENVGPRVMPVHAWSSRLISALRQGDDTEVTEVLADAEYHLFEGVDDSTGRGSDMKRSPLELTWEPKVVDSKLVSTSPPAKISATELRRLWSARHRSSKSAVFQTRSSAEHLLEDPSWVKQRRVTGRERGLAFHSVMQVLDLTTTPNISAVDNELKRLRDAGLIAPEVADSVDSEDVVNFLDSALGTMLRGAKRVYREQPFFHRIDLPDGNFITVQGVMDCLAELDDMWLLVDYKTDNIELKDADVTAGEYSAQVSVYMQVADQVIGNNKPLKAYVYFVHPAAAVAIEPVDVGSLFRSEER